MLSSRMHASTFEMICDAYILITIIRVHAPVQSHGADQLVSAIGSYGGLWRSAGGRREPGAAPAPVSPEQGQRRPARGHGRTPTSAPTEPQASPPRSPRRPNGSPCSPPPAPPRASWSWPPPMTRQQRLLLCCVGRIQCRASCRAAESCLLCMSPIERRCTATCRQCCSRGHTIRLC